MLLNEFVGFLGNFFIMISEVGLIDLINFILFIIVKEFFKGLVGLFSNVICILVGINILIYSIVFDLKKNVVFLVILDKIFIYYNFFIY